MATTQPIKSRGDIEKVRAQLTTNRDRTLFTLGINTAYRGGDLLRLNVGDVANLAAGEDLVLKEQKTGKTRRVTLNAACVSELEVLVLERRIEGALDTDPLFVSVQGRRLTNVTLSRLWESWCVAAGLLGVFGAHSGRKTWGYMQRTERKAPIEVLQKALNHSSPATTLIYLGIQSEELRDLYSAEF